MSSFDSSKIIKQGINGLPEVSRLWKSYRKARAARSCGELCEMQKGQVLSQGRDCEGVFYAPSEVPLDSHILYSRMRNMRMERLECWLAPQALRRASCKPPVLSTCEVQ